MNIRNLFVKFWPIITLLIFVLIFYWKFFLRGLLPIPADILVGAYYPWLINPPTGIAVQNPLPSDVVSLTYPSRWLVVNYLKSGLLPLWNPHILSGVPLLANFQAAALYPLNLLYFISSDFPLVWSIQVIFQSIFGLFFMYLFLRSHSLQKFPALFGSLVWGLGGFQTLWLEYNTVFHTLVYLPFILWAVRRMRDRPIYGLFVSFGLAASLTAGNPPLTLILIIGTALYTFFVYGVDFKRYLVLSYFLLLGLGLALGQILPGLEVSKVSIRSFDQVAAGSGIKFLPIHKLITLTSPDFFGNPATYNLWSIAGLYDNLTAYFGIMPLVVFILGIYSILKRDKLFIFAFTLFVFSLILIVDNPLSRFIGGLDVLGLSAMVMTRFSALTNFAIAVGSAVVLDSLLHHKIHLNQFFKPLLLVASMIILPVIILLVIKVLYLPVNSFDPRFIPQEINTFSATLRISLRNSVLPLAQILAVLIFIFLANKNNLFRKPWVLLILLFCLTFLDLFRFFSKYNAFSPASYLYPANALSHFLADNNSHFITSRDPILPPNTWINDQLSSPNGQDTLHSVYYNQFISLVNYNVLNRVSDRYIQISNFDSPLIDFLNVKYVLAQKWREGVPETTGRPNYPLDDQNKLPIVFEDGYIAILQRKNSLPKIFSVDRYAVAGDLAQEQKLLLENDLSNLVVLNQPPAIPSSTLSKAIITSEVHRGNQITFNTSSAKSSLIVLSTAFYPGWRYYLDDVLQTSPFRANHAFIALMVPEGSHRVRLTFLPNSVKTGLLLSMVSALALLITLLVILGRNKHHERRSS